MTTEQEAAFDLDFFLRTRSQRQLYLLSAYLVVKQGYTLAKTKEILSKLKLKDK